MEMENNIDTYLTEIAERLWSGHASVMIGAGFSRNAAKNENTSKKFLSWNDLGDIFYEKLHGKKPLDEKDKKYLNVLKLADEVESQFGRPTLDKILKNNLPDKEYNPSELHRKLLQLPWMDIFTTNYDTLLERTAEKILQQRYEIITNKEDLVWSTKPRIIKLHGSFPSKRPFIITEEDFRKYPLEFAPFVNTVQQSLLENTFCLIGFSGTDPNFLKWIGWIRDNLGKENSPKIFLIGILSLSLGEKKLLENRNIIPIDLSHFSEEPYTALMKFVKKLSELLVGERNKLNWPEKNIYHNLDFSKEFNKEEWESKYQNIINNWQEIRMEYPNWLILPNDKRTILSHYTESGYPFIYHIEKVDKDLAIKFLYELNWRLEKCLIPIFNEWIEKYEYVISQCDSETDKDFKLIELQLAMLRLYREEAMYEKWVSLAGKINTIKNKLTSELLARYYYERCLYAIFQLDMNLVRKELNEWKLDKILSYWEAKKAGIIAELGDLKNAIEILEFSLKEIRIRLNLSSINNDYLLASQEAYLLQLLKYAKKSYNYVQGNFLI